MASSGQSLGILGEALIALRVDFNQLRSDMALAKTQVKSGSDEIQKSVTDMGKALAIGVTAPIVAAGVALIAVGNKFDAVMDDIRATTGKTGEALEKLGESFKSLFSELPNDAKDIETALVVLNQKLGLTGGALEESATQMLNLSRIGKAELKPLVEDTAKLFGQWSVATSEQADTMDLLFKITQQTGANIGELTATLGQAAPIFKQLGFSLETSAELLGQWSKNGINADAALNGLRIAAVRFAKDGKDAEQGLKDVVARMQELGPGAASAKLAAETFGRGAVTMTDAIMKGAFSIDELQKKVRESTDTINKAAFDTLSFADKWKILQHQVEAALEPLGSSLLGVLEKGMPLVTGLAKVVGELGTAFKSLPDSAQTATFAIAGIFAALGPGLLLVGKIGEGFAKISAPLVVLSNSIPVLTARIWLMEAAETAASTAFGAMVLAAGPAIVAIAGVTAALAIGYQAYQLWQEAKERAAADDRQSAVDATNLQRLNASLGTSYKKLGDAVDEYNRRRAAGTVPTQAAGGGAPDMLAEFQKELAAAKAEVNGLSAAQRQAGESALIQGASQKKVQEALGLSDLAMGMFSKSADKAKTAFEALTKAQEEYRGAAEYSDDATQNYLNVLNEVGNATYEGIVIDAKRGVGQASLAAMYGVTEAAVTRVQKAEERMGQMRDMITAIELDGLKKSEDEYKKWAETVSKSADDVAKHIIEGAGQIRDAELATADFIKQSTLSQTDYQVAKIDEWIHAQEAAFKGTEQQRAAFNTQIEALAKAQTDALYIDNKAITDNSQESFQQIADKAQTTYEYMEAHSDQFSKATREHFKEIAEQAQKTADGIQYDMGTALDTLSKDFAQLAQVSGGSFSGIVQEIGTVVSAMKLGDDAAKQWKKSTDATGKALAAIGMAGAIASATQGGGIKGMLGGAATGAEMGFAIAGPWGAAAGAAIGFVVGLIRTDHRIADVARDSGEKFGTAFSDATGKAIQDSIHAGMTEVAAELNNLDKIIADAGGLSAKNIDLLTRRLHDVFSMVQTGQMTAAQATSVLDKNFSTFVTAATSGVGVLNSRITEMIKLQKQFGTQSQAINQYVQGQIGNLFSGLAAGLSGGGDALSKLKDIKSQMSDIDDKRSALMAKGVFEGSDIDALDKQWDDLKKQLTDTQALADATVVKSQAAAQAMAGAILAGIGELQREGVDFVTALQQATPAIQALQEQLTATGYDGGAAFAQLAQDVAVANDAIAGPALKAAAGFGQALVSLNNSGLLTQEMFSGLSEQIAGTRDALVAQGQDGGAVLRLLAPQLQQIWEIQKQTGDTLDENTQKLVDEAEAAGLVGEKMEGPQQQMIDALTETNDILTAIAKSLGADLPAAAAKGAKGVKSALETVDGTEVHVAVVTDYSSTGAPPDSQFDVQPGSQSGIDNTSYARSGGRVISSGVQYFNTSGIVKPDVQYFDTSGIVGAAPTPRNTDTVHVMATPGELLLDVARQGNLAKVVQDSLAKPADMVGGNVDMNLAVTLMIGDTQIGTFTEQVTWPQLKAMLTNNRAGSRTDARAVLGVK